MPVLCHVIVAHTLLHMEEGPAATLAKEARNRSGLSRRALAARAGVPTSTVSRIESGEIDPTAGMLRRIVEAAGSRLVLALETGDAEPTLASLSNAAEQIGVRLRIDWTRLRGFADWAAQHPEQLGRALADPPARTGTPLDAILAAFAEELAAEHGLPRPRWTRAVGPLRDEWAAPGTPRMRAEAAAATPEPFRRRNLVLARSALFRQAP
jgi:transcriptional regulator with XRE-family HTH domain